MKCPQCTIRNSVAATQCKECGTKLPRKSLSLPDLVRTTMTNLPAIKMLDGDAVEGNGNETAAPAAAAGASDFENSPQVSAPQSAAASQYSDSVYDAPGSVAPAPAPAERRPIRQSRVLVQPDGSPNKSATGLQATSLTNNNYGNGNGNGIANGNGNGDGAGHSPEALSQPAYIRETAPVETTPVTFNKTASEPLTDAMREQMLDNLAQPAVPPLSPQAVPASFETTGDRLPISTPIQAQTQSQLQAESGIAPINHFPGLGERNGGLSRYLKFGAIGVGVLAAGLIAINVLPSLLDPQVALEKVAKKVAAGPKSASDAEHIKAELESSAKDFLEKNAKLSSPELTARLQKIFPNSAFETRVFDLPKDMRLVEIDTMLQATDYLLSGKHVAVLRSFEVFDSAKIVPDGTDSDIVLLGHRNAQAGHQPQVRMFKILADGITDKTQEAVPPISGDGSAAFATNAQDINLDLSLASKAGEERLFTIDTLSKGPLTDETVKAKMTLAGGKYTIDEQLGTSPIACLRAAAFVLTDSTNKSRFRRYFVDGVLANAAGFDKLKVNPPLFTIKKVGSTAGSAPSGGGESRRSRRHRRHSDAVAPSSGSAGATTYLLNNAQDAFEVTVGYSGMRYLVTGVKRVKAENLEGSQAAVAVGTAAGTGAGTGSGTAVTTAASNAPVEETLKPSATPQDSVKSENVITKVDEFGSSKVVGVAPSVISPKVVEKQASVEVAPYTTGVSTQNVKVRKGAGRTFNSIGELAPGQTVQITGKQNDWFKIAFQGGEGYVNSAYLKDKASAAAPGGASSSTNSPAVNVKLVVAPAVTVAPVVAPVVQPKKTVAPVKPVVTEQKESAESRRRTRAKAAEPDTPSRSGGSGGSVVRKSKSVWDARSNRVGDINPGDRVTIVGSSSHGKYKVRLANGREGYVDKSAIEAGSGGGASNVSTEPAPNIPSNTSSRSSRRSRRHGGGDDSSSHADAVAPEASTSSGGCSSKSGKSRHKASTAPKPASAEPPQFVP